MRVSRKRTPVMTVFAYLARIQGGGAGEARAPPLLSKKEREKEERERKKRKKKRERKKEKEKKRKKKEREGERWE